MNRRPISNKFARQQEDQQDDNRLRAVNPTFHVTKFSLQPYIDGNGSPFYTGDLTPAKYLSTSNMIEKTLAGGTHELLNRMGYGLSLGGSTIEHGADFLETYAGNEEKQRTALRSFGIADVCDFFASRKGKEFVKAMHFFNDRNDIDRNEDSVRSNVKHFLRFIMDEPEKKAKVFRRLAIASAKMYIMAMELLAQVSCASDMERWQSSVANSQKAQPPGVRRWLKGDGDDVGHLVEALTDSYEKQKLTSKMRGGGGLSEDDEEEEDRDRHGKKRGKKNRTSRKRKSQKLDSDSDSSGDKDGEEDSDEAPPRRKRSKRARAQPPSESSDADDETKRSKKQGGGSPSRHKDKTGASSDGEESRKEGCSGNRGRQTSDKGKKAERKDESTMKNAADTPFELPDVDDEELKTMQMQELSETWGSKALHQALQTIEDWQKNINGIKAVAPSAPKLKMFFTEIPEKVRKGTRLHHVQMSIQERERLTRGQVEAVLKEMQSIVKTLQEASRSREEEDGKDLGGDVTLGTSMKKPAHAIDEALKHQPDETYDEAASASKGNKARMQGGNAQAESDCALPNETDEGRGKGTQSLRLVSQSWGLEAVHSARRTVTEWQNNIDGGRTVAPSAQKIKKFLEKTPDMVLDGTNLRKVLKTINDRLPKSQTKAVLSEIDAILLTLEDAGAGAKEKASSEKDVTAGYGHTAQQEGQGVDFSEGQTNVETVVDDEDVE